jgi:hypothetical protein
LYKRLTANSKKFICGDYKNFDAGLVLQLGLIVAKAANKFYDDGKEIGRIRKVLINTLFSSDHLIDNLCYSFKQGNPSGDALTSIVNCIVNMSYIRFVYLQTVEKDLYRFDSFVKFVCYGDDCLATVSGIALGKLTMYSMHKSLSVIGVEFTSADKTSIVSEYIDEQDVTFLKRAFVFDKEINGYLAPLDYTTIMEIARWSTGDETIAMDQMGRFNTSLLFISSHGEDKFKQLRKRYEYYCNLLRSGAFMCDGQPMRIDLDPNLLFTYSRCKTIMYPEHYGEMGDFSHLFPWA